MSFCIPDLIPAHLWWASTKVHDVQLLNKMEKKDVYNGNEEGQNIIITSGVGSQ
jgi:hypothetical protein